MADRLLLGAATCFAAASVVGTAVAVREPGLPGEPLGLKAPGPVPVQLALGLGSAVSAPWPMPVVAVWSAWRAAPGDRRAALTSVALGVMLLAGTLSEPVTWGRRPRSRLAAATVPMHLVTGVTMVLAGWRRLAAR